MTIKQQGGVFGRHPTFSTAEVDGNFSAGGTLYVDEANKRVGINTSSPADALEVSGSAAIDGSNPVSVRVTSLTASGGWTPGADWARLEFRSADTSSSADPDVTLSAFVSDAGGGQTGLRMYTTNANAFTRKMQIWPAGGVSVGSNPTVDPGAGNLQLDNGNLIIGTSGKGIDFSATAGTGTSELFSDYEEGTWTPVIDSATAGSGRVTLVKDARYTKIGNMVHATAYVELTTLGTGGSGSIVINGLPYTSVSGSGGNYFSSASVGLFSGLAANINYISGTVQPASTSVFLRGTTAAAASVGVVAFSTYAAVSMQLMISTQYTAA